MTSKTPSPSFAFVTLDVFTTTRYQGNPLALIRLPKDSSITQAEKQKIAREFNYSETVFLHDEEDVKGSPEENGRRRYDIFTPTQELPFAGHPTIGTLCYIAQSEGESSSQKIKLLARAGPIEAEFDPETLRAEAEIPHNVHVHEDVEVEAVLSTQPKLRRALASSSPAGDGARVAAAGGATTVPLVSIVNGMTFILVALSDVEGQLGAVETSPVKVPNARLDEGWNDNVVNPYFYAVLPSSGQEVTRLRTRMISQVVGEDPATGSAACTLASYLALRSGDWGKVHGFEIEQGVEMGRPSRILVKVELEDGGKAVKRVRLSGSAVVVSRGTIEL